MAVPRSNVKGLGPHLKLLPCSFGFTEGVDGVPYLNIANVVSGAGGNCDSIIESNEGAGTPAVPVDKTLLVRAVGDAVAAAAVLDFAAAGLTNLDGVLTFGTAGLGGNDWTVSVGAGSGLGVGVQVYEDTVNKTLTILFEDGVSTQANLAAAVGGTVNFTVVGGTGANVLAVTVDDLPATSLAGGAAQEYVETDADGERVTMHFEPGATTVAELEAAIAAYAAASGRIKVQTTGTGVSVLNANDAFGYTLLLTAFSDVYGDGIYSAVRTAVGTYTVTLKERYPKFLGGDLTLQLATAAAQDAQFGDYTQADGTLVVRTQDLTATAVDIAAAATDRVNMGLVFQARN